MLRQDHTPIQLPYWYEVKEGANFLFSDDVIANEMTTWGNTGNMKMKQALFLHNLELSVSGKL